VEFYLPELISPNQTASGAAFNTFTTKKSVDPVPIPVLAGGRLTRGRKMMICASGEYSTTGTPTLTWGFWFGTRALSITGDVALSSVITTPSGAAAFPWIMEWQGVCTGEGTSGTLLGQGYLIQGTSLTAVSILPIPITQALRTVTIDTTIERAFGVSATWGTSSASNSITVNDLRVMLLN
jgi:hypothetical protein